MDADWELSQSFTSDGQGIRAACVLPLPSGGDKTESEGDDGAGGSEEAGAKLDESDVFRIVVGNQGGGLCEFGVPSGAIVPIDLQHNHAVTALLSSCGFPGDEDHVYVTGCKDSVIRVLDAETHQLKTTLTGHEKPVTSLAWVATNSGRKFLVSGSWDGTAKVWDIAQGAMLATLPDHENSVCVAGLQTPESSASDVLTIATGSAGVAQSNVISGHTVRIWNVDTRTGGVSCKHSVANDHEGPIRDVAASALALASASNDGTVKIRSTTDGSCVTTLSFIHQLQQPPMLLSVIPVEETMVAASAEDGHVVVWDVAGGDQTSEPQILMHPNCVWNLVALPNGDIATCCDDGTLRIFTRSSERVASTIEREHFAESVRAAHEKKSTGPSAEEVSKLTPWEQSVTKRGTSEGQVHLFNKAGVAIAAQWSMASQTWIEVGQVMGSQDSGLVDGVQYDHVFPIEVDQTGGGVAKLQIGYNNGENHFVAAQRFIDTHMLPQHHLNEIANYIQQRVGNQAPTLGMAASAAPAVPTTGVPMVSYEYLPALGYKSFDLPAKSASTTLEKMKNKIGEFGKLSGSQISQVSLLTDTLAATNRYHASKVDSDDLNIVFEMMNVFDIGEVFPALDLARLTVLHPDASTSGNKGYWDKVIAKAFTLCESVDPSSGPAAVAIPMLSLRLFANAFRGGPGSRNAVVDHVDEALTCTNNFITSSNKNIRLSVATVLLNVSHFMSSNPIPAVASRIATMADSILSAQTYEAEAVTRTLIALGTVALASTEAKQTAKDLYIISRVEMAASPHGDVAKAVAKEVYHALS